MPDERTIMALEAEIAKMEGERESCLTRRHNLKLAITRVRKAIAVLETGETGLPMDAPAAMVMHLALTDPEPED